MDLLCEWLGPTVEQELGEVLAWRAKSDRNRSQLAGKVGHTTFDDDGSNLRIRSAKKPVVQIIKLVPNQEPLQACLSDSVSRIDATISKDAMERYREKTGKRLTDGTVGGFIQLLDFEIVATHLGSRQKRITLFVTELKFLGANGAGAYGIPRGIEEGLRIKELIQKLIHFRAHESARRQNPSKQPYSNNIVISQQETSGSQENSPQHTEHLFATQAPMAKRPADSSPEVKGPGGGSAAIPSKRPLYIPQTHAKASLNETGRTITEGEALLGLLERSKKLLPTARVPSKEHPRSWLASGLTPNSETGTHLAHVDSMRPPQTAAIKIVDDSVRSPGSATIPASMENTVGGPAFEIAISINQPVQDKRDAIRGIRKRISSREVKITKDQEKLLSSVDSWLPADPGKRGPVANLPISILDSLNKRADLQARRRVAVLKEQKPIPTPKELQGHRRVSSLQSEKSRSEKSSSPESDSDGPVSDSEWPPSPPRDQLPPDSSAENTDTQSKPNAHIRRSSNASSSCPTQSTRPTLLPVLKSLRNSAEISPRAISPSIVSNQARQESQHLPGSGTTKSSPFLASAPVSIGIPITGYPQCVDRDESEGEVRADSELKPRHSNYLRGSPKGTVERPPINGDLLQDRVLSSHQASIPLEPSPLQLPRAHPSIEMPNGRHRYGSSSNLYSIPPSPESDLEVAAPFSLIDKATLARKFTHHPIPSTASQDMEPFTQVKQTPYVKCQIQNTSPPRLQRQLSFPKSNSPRFLGNGNFSEDVDHVTQSTPSIVEVSSSETVINSTKENTNIEGVNEASETMNAIDDSRSHIVEPSNNSESHQTEVLNGGLNTSNESDTTRKPPAATSGEEGSRSEGHTQGIHDNDTAHIDPDIKRKASGLDLLSNNVAKRRKHFKKSRTFPIPEKIEDLPDPLDAARRYRHDFITSRQCSEADKPQKNNLTSSAVSRVEPPECGDVLINPEEQVAAGRQTLVDNKARAPSFPVDGTTKKDIINPKDSAPHQRNQTEPPVPSDAELATRSKSNNSIQGTLVGETLTQSNSQILNDLNKLTSGLKVEDAHPALNCKKSGEPVSKSDEEDRFTDMVKAPSYATLDHKSNNNDTQNTTPFNRSLNVADNIAGLDSGYNHLRSLEFDDTTQAVNATDVKASLLARTDEMTDQVMIFGAHEARPSAQSKEIMAKEASQRPDNEELMNSDSSSTRLYLTSDHVTKTETHDGTPGAQHGEAVNKQLDDLMNGTGSLGTPKLVKAKAESRVKGKFVDIPGHRSGLDDPEVQSSFVLQELPLADHSKSIPESRNTSTPVAHQATTVTQPRPQTVNPTQVVSDSLRATLQEGQKSESLAIAMSIPSSQAGLKDQPSPWTAISVSAPNLAVEMQSFTSPAEQSILSEEPQLDAYTKASAVEFGSTAKHKGPKSPSTPPHIFDRFKAAYPVYTGDVKHFGAVCRKIKTLVGLDRMLHQFLWDDFIIRHKVEYAEHLRQCAEDADDAVSYEDFYKTEIKRPLYCTGLVTPQNLDDVLLLSDTRSSIPSKRRINDVDFGSQPWRNPQGVFQEHSLVSEKSGMRARKSSERRETIDLTLDDGEDHKIKISEEIPTTPPMSSIRKASRSLPWMETNTHSPIASTQKLRQSLGEPIDAGARWHASMEPSETHTAFDSEASRDPDAMKNGRSIRETWGIGAHNVLESRYYDKIRPRHLQLMKDIANMVELEEARRLIYNQIHSRAGLHRGASMAVTVADLESVFHALSAPKTRKFKKDKVEDHVSRMTALPSRDAYQSSAVHRNGEGERPGEWWRDDNTPFKTFARAYKSIKPGNGNSFADDAPVKTKGDALRPGRRDKRAAKKTIDPLSWVL